MDATTRTLTTLILVITLAAVAIFTQFVRRKRASFPLRAIPAYQSIPLLVGEAIESARPLHLSFGGTGIGGINTALARPDIKTFLLFTGDKDFIRLVTTLRNRLGRRVIICGVPGSVSPDLVAAAGEEDEITMPDSPDIDIEVIQAIDRYVRQLHEGFVPTQSHMSRTLWRFLDRSVLPSEHIEAKVMEFLRKGILTKRQTLNGQNQELVTTELNPDHSLVQQALPGFPDSDPVEMEHESSNGLPHAERPNGDARLTSEQYH